MAGRTGVVWEQTPLMIWVVRVELVTVVVAAYAVLVSVVLVRGSVVAVAGDALVGIHGRIVRS